jgi:hypothetical protein
MFNKNSVKREVSIKPFFARNSRAASCKAIVEQVLYCASRFRIFLHCHAFAFRLPTCIILWRRSTKYRLLCTKPASRKRRVSSARLAREVGASLCVGCGLAGRKCISLRGLFVLDRRTDGHWACVRRWRQIMATPSMDGR